MIDGAKEAIEAVEESKRQAQEELFTGVRPNLNPYEMGYLVAEIHRLTSIVKAANDQMAQDGEIACGLRDKLKKLRTMKLKEECKVAELKNKLADAEAKITEYIEEEIAHSEER